MQHRQPGHRPDDRLAVEPVVDRLGVAAAAGPGPCVAATAGRGDQLRLELAGGQLAQLIVDPLPHSQANATTSCSSVVGQRCRPDRAA